MAIEKLDLADDTNRLRAAAEYSAGTLTEAKAQFWAAVPAEHSFLDVVVFGSYARQEAYKDSDFDFLVVAHSLPAAGEIEQTRKLLDAIGKFIKHLEDTSDRDDGLGPGQTGLFGQIQSAPDLVERIGLEQDTNTTHTRRCLLLQESQSVYSDTRHNKLLESVLARYLVDYEGHEKGGPPRFLINDLNRYWFTVAVDYQAKVWERLNKGWGTRYLKLLVTRRLSYVGAVIPLLLCSETNPATVEHLMTEYSHTALGRIAGLARYDEFEEIEALKTVLRCADLFGATLETSRSELDSVEPHPAKGVCPVFDEMKDLTKELGTALRTIFAGSLLGDPVHRYLVL